ncbi:DNA mismatch repair protein 6 [Chlorella vulgaris]
MPPRNSKTPVSGQRSISTFFATKPKLQSADAAAATASPAKLLRGEAATDVAAAKDSHSNFTPGAAAVTPPTAASAPKSAKASKVGSGSKVQGKAVGGEALGPAAVGRAIRVYWPGEDAWFTGEVVEARPAGGKCLVLYEDGDEEWVDLTAEKWAWVEPEEEKEKENQGGGGRVAAARAKAGVPKAGGAAGKAGAKAGGGGRKRKAAIVESDSGEEDEEDGAAAAASGSEYAASDDGESDEEDASLADECEEESADEEMMSGDGSEGGSRRRGGKGKDTGGSKGGAKSVGKGGKASGGAGSSRPGPGRLAATPVAVSGGSMGLTPGSAAASGLPLSALASGTSTAVARPPRTSLPAKTPGTGGTPATTLACTPAAGGTPLTAGIGGGGGSGEVPGSTLKEDAGPRCTAVNLAAFPFLHPDRLRDAAKRRPDHPDYDPRTLHIPPEWFKTAKVPPGQAQWWEFKARHFDCVLLFKMGKFYELFEMDAHLAVEALGLSYMKGDKPHAGFPEAAYHLMAERLARAGHRVVVIEQVETPEMLAARNKQRAASGLKRESVVQREKVAVLTRGTLTDAEMLSSQPEASYLLALAELPVPAALAAASEASGAPPAVWVGACAVDVATGQMLLGQWLDDELRSQLRAVLTAVQPAELVLPKGQLSRECRKVAAGILRGHRTNELPPGPGEGQFWDPPTVWDQLRAGGYWPQGSPLPPALAAVQQGGEGQAAAAHALGGCVSHLRDVLLDKQVLAAGRIEQLAAVFGIGAGLAGGGGEGGSGEAGGGPGAHFMALDGAALENLEVLENSEGGTEGTLLAALNNCVTPAGRRRLRQWLCRPLAAIPDIEARQDAVAALLGPAEEAAATARSLFKGVSDLERALARITAAGSGVGSARDAPHVILYEDVSKRKVRAYAAALKGLQQIQDAAAAFQALGDGIGSSLLKSLVTPGELFPSMADALAEMQNATDWAEAETSGRVDPAPGVDEAYDAALALIEDSEQQLKDFLQEAKKEVGAGVRVQYVSLNKESHVLEVPESTRVPGTWTPRANKKGVKRYSCSQLEALVKQREAAYDGKERAQGGILLGMMAAFARRRELWAAAVECMAQLDALMSLAVAAACGAGTMCRPKLVPWSAAAASGGGGAPLFRAKGLRHPAGLSGRDGTFVPNDIELGGKDVPPFLVLTGPNMGGKSTLMRQVCLAALMAQVGAWVPAESLELSPTDAVFVRMGARDRIMLGQSTFFVELSETSAALHRATPSSLVILDELGRGTSTGDGAAIAAAVLDHLTQRVGCRGMFATHYHHIADSHASDPRVSIKHMGCAVTPSPTADGLEEVTFLYRLADGACPKSYGTNVARLAGLPDAVVRRAAAKAQESEEERQAAAAAGAQGCSRQEEPRQAEKEQEKDLAQRVQAACTAAAAGGDAAAAAAVLELQREVQRFLRLHHSEPATMGKGGDAGLGARNRGTMRRTPSMMERLSSLELKLEARQKLQGFKNDMLVLKNIWFSKLADTADHAERLEGFYKGQAHAYDSFRSKFLWGRRPMLAACAARLRDFEDMVWVDLGGGTGENVDLMSSYIDLTQFKAIYVVDLCKSLCDQARKKVAEKGWRNVHVVEADACHFAPPEGIASLVTFSYSLSMIPPFHAAVDRAISYLDREQGLLGVCDFFASSKYDLPLRQMSPLRRFFWRSVFDSDNIDVGPERRQYLDHQLSRVWEYNDEGSIPYVPYFRAPWYCWVGRIPKLETLLVENKVEAPAFFPPSFLYTQSWEDPRADEPYLQINEKDVCLTLTSGGCNSLHLCINGARKVYSCDCNPAQSALLELKQVAIRQLNYEDVWSLFGEGKHPRAAQLFERDLAPFLSQSAIRFWRDKLRYFSDGLYYHGGMGKVVHVVQQLARWLGMGRQWTAVAEAPTLEAQRQAWEALWVVRLLRAVPAWALSLIADFAAVLFFNRATLWFGGGIPFKQYQLIMADGVHMSAYAARCFDGVAASSHLRGDNYFYYNCMTGKFARDNCPAYLTPSGFQALKGGALEALTIVNGFFLPTLRARQYTKVILMDHLDWLTDAATKEVAAALAKQVAPGGRVIWRSAANVPPYARFIADAGFEVTCIQRADQGFMDRVNMYASFWVGIKKAKKQYYEELWREGVEELVSHLETEFPRGGGAAAPKKLGDWARLYIAYVRTLRKLCEAHDGMVQPQMRACLRGTLEACMGRLLELRAWLVHLNGGVDVLDLGEQLAAAGVTPDAVELPVPTYFKAARAQQMAARAAALASAAVPAEPEAATFPAAEQAEQAAEPLAADGNSRAAAAQAAPAPVAAPAFILTPQQHIQKQREETQQEQQAACLPEEDVAAGQRRHAAAVLVQAAARGCLARRRAALTRREELEFLSLLPPDDSTRSAALQLRVAAIAAERRERQAERQQELEAALVGTKVAVRQQEGFAMKDQVREKLNDWFLKSRDAETGEYANLPEAAKGGSKAIVQPPPPSVAAEAAAAAATAAKAKAAKATAGASSKKPEAAGANSNSSGSSSGSGRAGKQQVSAVAAPTLSLEYLGGLKEAVQEYMDVWQQYEPIDPSLALLPAELQGLPQPRGGSGLECYDAAMVTGEVRPVVFEEVRLEADQEMRLLIQSIKDMLKTGRAARLKKKMGEKGKGKGKKKGKGSEGQKSTAPGTSAAKKAAAKAGQAAAADGGDGTEGEPGAKQGKKKRKDLTEGYTVESIFAELAAAGLVSLPPPASVCDLLGCDRAVEAAAGVGGKGGAGSRAAGALAGRPRAGGKKANAAPPAAPTKAPGGVKGKDKEAGPPGGGEVASSYPEPSLALVRQALVASCVLPLGAHPALSKLQTAQCVLLYGPAGSGKTLAATAVAHQAGAMLFDLSPAATAGKFPGQEAASMVHKVFKAAKALAPAVVLIEEVDQVFITDKARVSLLTPPGAEPPNRIRKQLAVEVAGLVPSDGVLVICTSRQPQACVKKDERALRTFIQRYIQLPLPEYGSRCTLLQAFAQREGLMLGESVAVLAQLSEGLAAGQLQQLVHQLASRLHTPAIKPDGSAAAQPGHSHSPHPAAPLPAAIVDAMLELLPSFAPLSEEAAQELREWTARAHQPLPPEEPPKDKTKKK